MYVIWRICLGTYTYEQTSISTQNLSIHYEKFFSKSGYFFKKNEDKS